MWWVRPHGVKRSCGARDDGHVSLHMLTPVNVQKPSSKTRLKLGLLYDWAWDYKMSTSLTDFTMLWRNQESPGENEQTGKERT